MKKISICAGIAAIAAVMFAGTAAWGGDASTNSFRAELRGVNESPLTLSAARGTLRLTVNDDNSSVHFVLSYQGLQTHVLFAHIHIGQPNINGGVTVFFCDNSPENPKSPNACPDNAGTVEGDFTAADVIGLPSQQIAPNDLAKLLRAIRKGQTYGNVHTMTSPGGEIRGQIFVEDDD